MPYCELGVWVVAQDTSTSLECCHGYRALHVWWYFRSFSLQDKVNRIVRLHPMRLKPYRHGTK